MKKLVLSLVLVLASSSAFAASPDAIKAAVDAAKGTLSDITSMEQEKEGKCPDCYLLKFEGTNEYGDAAVRIETERLYSGEIGTKVVGNTR